MFTRVTVFQIAGGPVDPLPLEKGVGTKRLGKGRVKSKHHGTKNNRS